jgi:hypothetical protein
MAMVMDMTMMVHDAAGVSLRCDRLGAIRRGFRICGRLLNLAGGSLRRSRRVPRLLARSFGAGSSLIRLRRCRLGRLDVFVRAAARHQRKRQQRAGRDSHHFRRFCDQPFHPFSSLKFYGQCRGFRPDTASQPKSISPCVARQHIAWA